MGIDNYLKIIKEGVFGRDVRQAIHDGIEQVYNDATFDGNTNMEVAKARGDFEQLSDRLINVDEQLNRKAGRKELEETEAKIRNIVSASPKGVYENLSALQSAHPTGDNGIYLTSNNGHWNYWNGSTWTDGGVYQATEIEFASVTNDKLRERYIIADKISTNLFDKSKLWPGYFDTTGAMNESDEWFISDYISMKPNQNYVKSGCVVTLFNSQGKFVGNVDALTNDFTTNGDVRFARISVIKQYIDSAQLQIGDTLSPYEDGIPKISTKNIFNFEKEVELLTNGTNSLFPWRKLKKDGDVLNLGEKPVFESYRTGNFIFFNIDGKSPDFKIEEGNHLVLEWDDNSNATELDFTKIKIIPVSSKRKQNEYVLATHIAGVIHSPIPAFQSVIDSEYSSNDKIEPLKIHAKLSDFAPKFYNKHKSRDEDTTVVLIQDSIGTTNYYTTPRTDAKNRPPLMTEHAYVTYIEEQLRWDGQKYYRYDTGIFTETATTAVTKEYDMVWDRTTADEGGLPTANNRPALTRVLDGTNASVSYTVPSDVKRCDFIFRTDSLNATSATVTVASGILQVFDEATQTWVEANGYTYSAKESGEIISGIMTIRKSMYQKRLKMKVVGTLNNTVITITNNGEGRLTYWGIQTGMRDVMFDFILSARGGHSIQRLEMYEAWDVDYFKPDLILWGLPIQNHNIDVGNNDFTPKNMGTHTTTEFATTFLNKALALKDKSYAPELVSWVMCFATGNNGIDANNNWVFGYCDDGTKVSIPSYVAKTVAMLNANDINIIDMTSLFIDYLFKRSVHESVPVKDGGLKGSGVNGNSITIDGGHFNTFGAKLSVEMFGSFFLQ
ncbi:TPA: hypothetical protein ACGPAZ_000312 [Streptococcus suis]